MRSKHIRGATCYPAKYARWCAHLQGQGNPDWNYSAPHGAGSGIFGQKQKKCSTVKQYTDSMSGIYTTCINNSTLDEAPFAYKDYQEIMQAIEPTVEIIERIIPIYNFKAN